MRPKILLGLVALAALRFAFFAADDAYATDDAWISFRVARNLLEHGALTYDLARPPVEGMTNLLWTLLSTTWTAALPGLDPLVVAQLLGGLAHLCTVGLAGLVAAELAGGAGSARDSGKASNTSSAGTLAAGAAAALLALSGSLAFYAASGMETALDGLFFLLAVRGALRAMNGRASAGGGAALALLAASRPEGVLAGGLICLWVLRERRDRPVLLRLVAPFVLAVCALEAFRLFYYGSLVPNTFHAKPGVLRDGFAALRDWWLDGLGLIGPLAAVPLLARSRRARGLALLVAVLAAGVVWSGGDWMPGYRRFVPAMIGFALLAGAGVEAAQGRVRLAAAAAVLAALGGSVVATALHRDGRRVQTAIFEAAGRAAQLTPGVRDVALVDIGRFGYAYRGSIFDLGALTDAHLARLPGPHLKKAWDSAYFAARHPDLVLLLDRGSEGVLQPERAVEADVLGSMRDLGDYLLRARIPMVGGTHLLVFSRRRLVLPDALWGPRPE